MKNLLQIIGIFFLIAGLGVGFNTLILGLGVPTPNPPIVLSFALGYMFSGLAGFALFTGLAQVLRRLDSLEN